jgi:hypothetical protein
LKVQQGTQDAQGDSETRTASLKAHWLKGKGPLLFEMGKPWSGQEVSGEAGATHDNDAGIRRQESRL